MWSSPLNTGTGDGGFDRVLHGEFSHIVDHLVVKIRIGRPSKLIILDNMNRFYPCHPPFHTGLSGRADHTSVVIWECELSRHGERSLIERPGSDPASKVGVWVELCRRKRGGTLYAIYNTEVRHRLWLPPTYVNILPRNSYFAPIAYSFEDSPQKTKS